MFQGFAAVWPTFTWHWKAWCRVPCPLQLCAHRTVPRHLWTPSHAPLELLWLKDRPPGVWPRVHLAIYLLRSLWGWGLADASVLSVASHGLYCLGGYLEVPDVHQVQQGLQDVPCDSDCVRREVRTGGRRTPLGAARVMAALCMVAALSGLAFFPFRRQIGVGHC